MAVSLSDLAALSRTLGDAGIVHALGGSGLLLALGLIESLDAVGDWDITTDAAEAAVAVALEGYRFERHGATSRFRTAYLLRVELPLGTADVMGSFAVDTGSEVVRVPTTVTDVWHGVPLGDPAGWERAYRAMGRDEKAELLARRAP